ncbi:hypothetical protein [Serratia marcescens]|uniref:hypothetical protein n=1 Tax=Serratia marcescens TaxID=615 RepID=UPI000745192D|nr:hypothetical protein [Serratia marcescens]CVG94112.1 Uncharacterised protein [Serratia marcescens]
MSKNKRTKAAHMAIALAAAMAPVPASSLGYMDIANTSAETSTTLQALPGAVAYLPIEEATQQIRLLTDRLRFHLKNLRDEWEEKQYPIEMQKQSPLVQKHLMRELDKRISVAQKFIDAVKIALDDIEDNAALRSEIITFGRAVASMRYSAEDFLSFIEQTKPPKKTMETNVTASAEEVKAMIRAEHKQLGLSAPQFARG